jgi:hypothetical protein
MNFLGSRRLWLEVWTSSELGLIEFGKLLEFFLVRLQFFCGGIKNVLGFELILSTNFLRILDDVQ